MNYVFLIIFFTSISLNSNAEETEKSVEKARWYQVNFTLFQQQPDRKLDESFKFTPLTLDMADIIHLKNDHTFSIADSGMNASLVLHHENANNLAYTEQSIDEDWVEKMSKLDPVTQPILYNVQWQQPVYEQGHSLPIYFESSSTHLGNPQIKGLFHLHVSRYLHSKVDLQFLPGQATSSDQIISFEESRRMRSKEMHYIDHPLVGAIIRIIPVTHPLEINHTETTKEKTEEIPTDLDSALNVRL